MSTSPYHGHFDELRGRVVHGWAWCPSEPERQIKIIVSVDGLTAASGPANGYRQDLEQAGIGDGRKSFGVPLPIALMDGAEHEIMVAAEDGTPLIGSPRRLLLPDLSLVRLPPESHGMAMEEGATALSRGAVKRLIRWGHRLSSPPPPSQDAPLSLPWSDYAKWRPAHAAPATPEPALVPGRLTRLPGADGLVALLDEGAAPLSGALSRAAASFRALDADLLYGDAEADTPQGPTPWFRPDWSYDLFLAQDYMRGLVLVRETLLAGMPLAISPAEARMRAVERARPGAIRHLPEVLARLGPAAPETRQSLTVIYDHLVRRNLAGAAVEALANGAGRRVHWPVPAPPPLISLIIATRGRLDALRPCIDSIRRLTTYPAYEIIIVDNRSRDPGTQRYLADGQAVGAFRIVPYDAPFNLAAMNNAGAGNARGAMLGFIDDDVELISPDWLVQAAGILARPEVGALGAKLRSSDGMIQHGGIVLGVGGLAGNAFQHLHADDPGYFHRIQVAGNYSAVTGSCLFMRTETFAAIGGFDVANLPVAFNDIDLCLRLRERDLLVVWTPHMELYRRESISRDRAFTGEAYLRHRWREILTRDPYYNPNLNLDSPPFSSLASPPRHKWGT